ncbi:hypothetical protein ADS79_00635 [Brevibacillus reuszeri]|uniref:Uncharacterized protein n=1 Tax=Brevibacillus reuszeri TaxID=54915 RepID=A0A0K9Z1C1_9BACL|nr:hypothetical protein ADS79_00635 [Brevibacillus reuszeri]
MPAWLKKSPPQAQSTISACTCGKISEDTNALAVVMLLKEYVITSHRGSLFKKIFPIIHQIEANMQAPEFREIKRS